MKTIKTVILSAILSTLLISCTITPPPSAIQTNPEVRYRQLISLKTWNIQGVIALNSARDSGSANLHWQQNGQTFNLSLFGPFGANAIQIFGSSAKVTLVNSNGQTFHAKNAEQLLYEQTGWQLPVSSLYYWIRGLAVPAVPAQQNYDIYHRLTKLYQNGWQINFKRYSIFNELELPTKIELLHPQLKVKLVIYQWL